MSAFEFDTREKDSFLLMQPFTLFYFCVCLRARAREEEKTRTSCSWIYPQHFFSFSLLVYHTHNTIYTLFIFLFLYLVGAEERAGGKKKVTGSHEIAQVYRRTSLPRNSNACPLVKYICMYIYTYTCNGVN